MKKNVLTHVLTLATYFCFAFLLAFFPSVAAETTIPSEGSSGGGGGSGTLPKESHIYGQINQSVNLDGFNASLYAANESAWENYWTDEETGQTHTFFKPQQSYGNFWFLLKQGFLGRNYIPAPVSTSMNRWNDDGRFSIAASFPIVFTDEVLDWIAPPQVNFGWDFGFNYSISTCVVKHEEYWIGQPPIQTDDIDGNLNFSFRDSLLEYARFGISETKEWWSDGYYPGIRIDAVFNIQYIGDQEGLEMLNAMIPAMAVPEPCTILLLILGLKGVVSFRKTG